MESYEPKRLADDIKEKWQRIRHMVLRVFLISSGTVTFHYFLITILPISSIILGTVINCAFYRQTKNDATNRQRHKFR